MTRKKWMKLYKQYVISKKRKPNSIKAFLTYTGFKKDEFEIHFNSLKQLENNLWKSYYKKTLKRIKKDDEFEQLALHEKHLTFLFSFVEELSQDRDFLQISLNGVRENRALRLFKNSLSFMQRKKIKWISGNSKMASIPTIDDIYTHVLWKQSILTLLFWLRDDSVEYTETDQFIEKSTKVMYDLMDTSALYSMLDLGKFVFQKFKPQFTSNFTNPL